MQRAWPARFERVCTMCIYTCNIGWQAYDFLSTFWLCFSDISLTSALFVCVGSPSGWMFAQLFGHRCVWWPSLGDCSAPMLTVHLALASGRSNGRLIGRWRSAPTGRQYENHVCGSGRMHRAVFFLLLPLIGFRSRSPLGALAKATTCVTCVYD